MTDKNTDNYQYPEGEDWAAEGVPATEASASSIASEPLSDNTDKSDTMVEDGETDVPSDTDPVPAGFLPKIKHHCQVFVHQLINRINAESVNKIFKSRLGRLGSVFIVILILGSLLHSCGGHHHAISNTGASLKSQAPSSTVADNSVQPGAARATASLQSEPPVPSSASVSVDHKQVHVLNNAVNTVQQQVSAMSGAQAQEAAHVAALNDKMERMVNLMAAQQAAQAKIAADKARVALKKKHKKQRIALPTYHYALQAIVPGRAWVMDNYHVMHTIAVGDTLPDYGQVQFLDADKGTIITSSGKVINFSHAVG